VICCARTSRAQGPREELSQFFALSSTSCCIAGMDGQFKRVNDSWQRHAGLDREELTGRPLSGLHPSGRPRVHLCASERRRRARWPSVLRIAIAARMDRTAGSAGNARAAAVRGLILRRSRRHDEKRTAKEPETAGAGLTVVNHELEAFSYSVGETCARPRGLRHHHGYGGDAPKVTNGNLSEQAQRYLRPSRMRASR